MRHIYILRILDILIRLANMPGLPFVSSKFLFYCNNVYALLYVTHEHV